MGEKEKDGLCVCGYEEECVVEEDVCVYKRTQLKERLLSVARAACSKTCATS